jgi:Raf kinase inhibitor-like YbhB/YbcL family protein
MLASNSRLYLWTMFAVSLAGATNMSCTSREDHTMPNTTMPNTIRLTSPAFAQGQPIPKKHAVAGEDVSPPLQWDNVPAGAKELALIVDDPDAPTAEPWVHWVIFKIPPETRELPEGVPTDTQLTTPVQARQGHNTWGDAFIGYKGPEPPSGTHRYYFKLYALDQALELKAGADKKELLAAMQGHILAQGELMGTLRSQLTWSAMNQF